MKAYSFRLESVLKVRRIEENQAKGALALANLDARRAADEVAVRETAYTSLPAGPSVASTEGFLSDRWRRTTSSAAVLHGLQLERDAQVVVAERRGELTAAATKVSAIERLDERRREEHALEQSREEAVIVDELVTGRFRREAVR